MANNELYQIKAGLVSYIGAAQDAIQFEGLAKNQIVAGLLADEILAVAQTEKNTPCNPYILVPLFKANIIFLRQQQYALSKDEITEETKNRILEYEAVIEVFQKLIKENEAKDGAHDV